MKKRTLPIYEITYKLGLMTKNEIYQASCRTLALFQEIKETGGVCDKNNLFAAVCRGKSPEDIKNKTLLSPLLNRLKEEADNFVKTEINVLPFSLFKLFDTTGNRIIYQSHYFLRRKRLTILALASWLWKQPEHIAALEDTIWAICEEYSWCLPAHMEGQSLTHDNRRKIDLFAGETGFALAEILAMTGGILHPAIVNRARDEIMYRVIDSFINQDEPQRWELMDNNWCAVCAGSVAGAAMYMVEDEEKLAALLERLHPTFDRFLASFSSDGACLEGLSYWTYGVGFYINYTDLLYHRTAGKINLIQEDGFDKIAKFQQYCYFPQGATLNFSDANEKGKFRLGLSCYLAEHIKGVEIPLPSYLVQPDGKINLEPYQGFIDNCGRFSLALRDLLWAKDTLAPYTIDRRSITLPDAQWLLCSGAGNTGFAAKGGHNDEPHSHNDVGSFIFYKNGNMLLLDLGAGEYTKDNFSEKRYTIFCNRSESHNLPIISGQGQKAGKEFAAKDCRITPDGSMSLDLAPAYDIPALKKLDRFFHFDIDTGILKIKDSFIFTDSGLEIIERFILPTEPQVSDGHCTFSINGTSCSIRCSEKAAPQISAVNYRNHDGKDACIFTADFYFQPKDNSFDVEFTIE